jgi:hypothetical protein
VDDDQVRRLQAEAQRLEARQAEVERARDAARARDNAPPAPRSPDGFVAMITLYSGWPMAECVGGLVMGSVFLTIGATLLASITSWDGENATIAAGLTLIGSLPWLFLLTGVVRYPSFRGWRDRLPFAVGGHWDMFAASREAKWYPTRFEIILTEKNDGAAAALEAMLRIFSVHANQSHFRPGPGGSLTAWTAKGLVANGDTGGRIGWKLYRFISGDLARFARSGAPVGAVRITFSKGFTVHEAPDR